MLPLIPKTLSTRLRKFGSNPTRKPEAGCFPQRDFIGLRTLICTGLENYRFLMQC